MKRILLLGGLLAVGGLSLTVSAYQAPAAPKVIEVEKLKDNLFVLKGGGGNTAVFVGADGITVVDTKNPGWGQPILDLVERRRTAVENQSIDGNSSRLCHCPSWQKVQPRDQQRAHDGPARAAERRPRSRQHEPKPNTPASRRPSPPPLTYCLISVSSALPIP